MDGPPYGRNVEIVVPDGVMRDILKRARDEWGDRAVYRQDDGPTLVRIWPGGKRLWDDGSDPAAAFAVKWDTPTAGEATIEELRWDPAQGSSEQEVRAVIDALAGYPVAS